MSINTDPRVLLVDDDTSLLQLLAMRISSRGYQVISAESGQQALDYLSQHKVDVVLTDLRMEQVDGLALLQKVQQLYPRLPVIMMTAHGSIPDAVAATREGVFAFLTKPIDKDELFDSLEQAVAIYGNQSEPERQEGKIITRSGAMLHVLEQAKMLASTDVNVLITGQSGTGKELLAQTIHDYACRDKSQNQASTIIKSRKSPFVAINCGAVPAELLESELFGHKKGAFTGAVKDHQGLFQQADGGTLFLDEIGDMPINLQVKLLRVLQEKTIRPVGSSQEIPINVRVLSATHRDLKQAIEQQSFREDLYYRLNVVNLSLPPLKSRLEDVPLLAQHFAELIYHRNRGASQGRKQSALPEQTVSKQSSKKFAPEALAALVAYHWPGNIRQLQNVIEQVVVLTPGNIISEQAIVSALPEAGQTSESTEITSLNDAKREFERDYLIKALQLAQGNIAQAAKLAKRNRSDFYKLVKKHDIDLNLL